VTATASTLARETTRQIVYTAGSTGLNNTEHGAKGAYLTF
jgi:hypothetical protein